MLLVIHYLLVIDVYFWRGGLAQVGKCCELQSNGHGIKSLG
jgi:hypothetical protein